MFRPTNNWDRWLAGHFRRRDAARLARYRSPIEQPMKRAARAALRTAVALWALALLCCLAFTFQPVFAASGANVPAGAQRHQLTLKREAQRVWGLGAPVATFAAQVHQESRWREDARSPVGAQGLAQFMPGTAQWIGGLYESLGERAPANPTWALRALVVYDKWLHDRVTATDSCERMAFALSAYNGGLGWVQKRKRASLEPGVCMGTTCDINPGITAAAQAENRHYPVVILRRHEPLYRHWGAGSCT